VELACCILEGITGRGAFLTGPMSSPGDSGSLVLNGQNQAVGLLFAGSDRATVCNRIQNVLGLLGVAL